MTGYTHITSSGNEKVLAQFPDGSVRCVHINPRTGYARWTAYEKLKSGGNRAIHVPGSFKRTVHGFSFHPDMQEHVDWIMKNPPKRISRGAILTDENAYARRRENDKRYRENNRESYNAARRRRRAEARARAL